MNKTYIDTKKIPQHDRERLGAALLKATRTAFEDPKIQREFAAWQAKQKFKQTKRKN